MVYKIGKGLKNYILKDYRKNILLDVFNGKYVLKKGKLGVWNWDEVCLKSNLVKDILVSLYFGERKL